jgi:hypothetical protein
MKNTLEEFRRTLDSAHARLLQMSEAESERRPAEGKWSAKEIIGHLIDSAANNHGRFVSAQFKDDLVFAGYEQEKWVAAQHYQEASWSSLLELWRSYNQHLLHLSSFVPPEILTRQVDHHSLHKIAWKPVDENSPATLEYLIRDYVDHLNHHLRQIFGTQ